MNDSYKELLVSKEQGVKDKLIRVVSIHSYRTGRVAYTFDR